MHYDATITLGSILAALSIVGAILLASWRVGMKVGGLLAEVRHVVANHGLLLERHERLEAKVDRLLELSQRQLDSRAAGS